MSKVCMKLKVECFKAFACEVNLLMIVEIITCVCMLFAVKYVLQILPRRFYVSIRSHGPIEHANSGSFGGEVEQDDVPHGGAGDGR